MTQENKWKLPETLEEFRSIIEEQLDGNKIETLMNMEITKNEYLFNLSTSCRAKMSLLSRLDNDEKLRKEIEPISDETIKEIKSKKGLSQNQQIKFALDKILAEGKIKSKTQIYNWIVKNVKVPRTTVRRVATGYRAEMKAKLKILEQDTTPEELKDLRTD